MRDRRVDIAGAAIRQTRARLAQTLVGALGAACCALTVAGAPQLAFAVPSFDEVRHAWHSSETRITDRHGELIQTVRTVSTVRQLEWVSLAEVSPALQSTLIASEDRRFYQHGGVDWISLGAAALSRMGGGHARGASTLTMQLAGLIDADLRAHAGGRSLAQKFDQVTTALEIESKWSKEEILEAYLNLAGFRGELVGIDAVSAALFQKYPSGLDARESALTVALLRAPEATPQKVSSRACALLTARDLANECAGLADYAKLVLGRPSQGRLDRDHQLAPHLAHHLVAAARARGAAPEVIRTTLDASLQRVADAQLRRQLIELSGRNVDDGAVLVLDNATGDVLAWVGSSGGLSVAPDVDGVLAGRQAGSTLKPFLYEFAIERRWLTAASLLDDSPVDLQTGAGQYIPEDYDHRFRGLVSLRTALGSSLNVPAVRTLVMVTPERFHQRLTALGFKLRENGGYYGYSLALGSPEVSLATLANAYRSLANGGRTSPWRTRMDDARAPSRPVMDPAASFIVTDILADREARTTTFGLDNVLNTRGFSAVKTGTSKDMRDNWCVGFSARYTVAVWVGNQSGHAMWDVSGVSGAAPVWRSLMDYLASRDPLSGERSESARPTGLVVRQIRYEHDIEPVRDEIFLAGTQTADVRVASMHGEIRARIVAPVDGTILALDPDIPAANQLVSLRASDQSPANARWSIDGRSIAQGRHAQWRIWPGRHELTLLSQDGSPIDRVHFEVRGAFLRAQGAGKSGSSPHTERNGSSPTKESVPVNDRASADRVDVPAPSSHS